MDELKGATWTGSPRTDADGQCQPAISPKIGRALIVSSRCATRRNRTPPPGPAQNNTNRFKDPDAYYPPECSIRAYLKETYAYLETRPNLLRYVLTPKQR